MEIRERILHSAERVFDRQGFTASGMDLLTRECQVSTRTLYKHLGNKNLLAAAVLRQRRQRFFQQLQLDGVDSLFDSLEAWAQAEGSRGCLFLRAQADMGHGVPEIEQEVSEYRAQLAAAMRQVAEQHVPAAAQEAAASALLVLFEGAVTASSYVGVSTIQAARNSAALVLSHSQP